MGTDKEHTLLAAADDVPNAAAAPASSSTTGFCASFIEFNFVIFKNVGGAAASTGSWYKSNGVEFSRIQVKQF
jgi:hypothetical protein